MELNRQLIPYFFYSILFYSILFYSILFLIIILFYLLFRAASGAYGGSQARGPIGAAAASLRHSNAGSESRLQPTPQLTATPDP